MGSFEQSALIESGLVPCPPSFAFEITNPHEYNYNNTIYNPNCFFKSSKKRTREQLTNKKLLQQIHQDQFCECWEFAWLLSLDDYQNVDITEEDFCYLAANSGAFRFAGLSKIKYNLDNPTIHYQDPYVKDVLMNYYPSIYKSLKQYTKTPRPGRMYYNLLKYCLPKIGRNRHNKLFNDSYEETLDEVRNNLDPCDPLSVEEALELMPKNTSGGFTSIASLGKRVKKGEMIPQILQEYDRLKNNTKYTYRHNILATRGHLSKRDLVKSRYIWIVPPETILAETRFAQPFYRQIRSKEFFKTKILTGKGTLPNLKKFLLSNQHLRYINTDISGWDAMGCTFVQKDLFNIYKAKLQLNSEDKQLFQYVVNNNIRTTLCLPSGVVLQKSGGVSTGTYYTLINNSLKNIIFCRTVLRMMKELELCADQKWLGDDFAFFPQNQGFNLEVFGNLLEKYFGLLVKPEKCIDTMKIDDRKFIGYQLKQGDLWRPEVEFFAGALYSEHFTNQKKQGVEISLGKIFSYLLIGGVNQTEFYDFFFLFVGYWKEELNQVEFVWKESLLPGILRVLKVVYALDLPSLNLDSYKNFDWYGLKNFLLYDSSIELYSIKDVN